MQYQKGDETRGDRVWPVDWADVARNDWYALNQFSIQGPKLTRRPEVVLFLNGLARRRAGAEEPRRRERRPLGRL